MTRGMKRGRPQQLDLSPFPLYPDTPAPGTVKVYHSLNESAATTHYLPEP